MKISTTVSFWLGTIVVVVALSSGRPANAQVLIMGRTAADNASAAGGRAPGALASAGVARALQAAQDGRSIHSITETQNTSPGPTGQFVASAGSAVVTQLFDFFFFFVDRLLVRAGLPSIFPAQLPPPITGGSGGTTPGAGTGGTPAPGGTTPGTGTGTTPTDGGTPTTGGTPTVGTPTVPAPGTITVGTPGTGTGTTPISGGIPTTGGTPTVGAPAVPAPGTIIVGTPSTGTGSAPTGGGRRPVRKTAASTDR